MTFPTMRTTQTITTTTKAAAATAPASPSRRSPQGRPKILRVKKAKTRMRTPTRLLATPMNSSYRTSKSSEKRSTRLLLAKVPPAFFLFRSVSLFLFIFTIKLIFPPFFYRVIEEC